MSPSFRNDRQRANTTRLPTRPQPSPPTQGHVDDVIEDDDPVRPFFLTGGRTRTDQDIAFETIVIVTERGQAAQARLSFELADIALLARSPLSVAEVSAVLKIPITVARVLCGDLVAAGVLDRSMPLVNPSDDVDLIKRLIHGIRSL